MLDFHSHILPEIDDGAQNVDESITMLKMLKDQGVNTVALTSHFIAMDESPAEFLENRKKSYELLLTEIQKSEDSLPKLLLGAEVYYYPGITKMEELSSLTLGDTNLLLLEMPMAPWGEYTIKELIDFANFSDIRIVIAHIERSLKFQKRDTIDRLLDNDILLQSNASFFYSRKTKRKALKMFNEGKIHFLGSDCHNIKYRPPKIDEAINVIKEKFGLDSVKEFFEYQKNFL
ncbi:MAG: hypothetical protein IKB73_05585 [Ruminococcus sp.]|nr:hypothetical protein [Ruminococcus sp.]